MTRHRLYEHGLAHVVFLILAVVALEQILSLRGMFEDSTSFLVDMLQTKYFSNVFHENNRTFTYYFTQFPVVMALRLGVRNLPALMSLYSSCLLVAPLVFWAIALWKTQRDFLFWPFLLLFCFAYFNANFFIPGEYNFAFALTACCLAYLLQRRPLHIQDLVILLCAAVLSIKSYPSTLLTGPTLAGICCLRCVRAERRAMQIYWCALGIIFAISVLFGLNGVLDPANPQYMEAARDTSVLHYHIQFYATLLCFALPVAALVLGNKLVKDAAAALVVLMAGFLLFHPWLHPSPGWHRAIRAYVGIFFAVSCFGLAVFRFYGLHFRFVHQRLKSLHPLRHMALPTITLFCVLAWWDIESSLEFGNYLDDYRQMVHAYTGVMRFEDTAAYLKNSNKFNWNSNPTLSLLLRDNPHQAVIANRNVPIIWQLFDPYKEIPDLSRYYNSN